MKSEFDRRDFLKRSMMITAAGLAIPVSVLAAQSYEVISFTSDLQGGHSHPNARVEGGLIRPNWSVGAAKSCNHDHETGFQDGCELPSAIRGFATNWFWPRVPRGMHVGKVVNTSWLDHKITIKRIG